MITPAFWRTFIPFSIVAVPTYIPSNSAGGFPSRERISSDWAYLLRHPALEYWYYAIHSLSEGLQLSSSINQSTNPPTNHSLSPASSPLHLFPLCLYFSLHPSITYTVPCLSPPAPRHLLIAKMSPPVAPAWLGYDGVCLSPYQSHPSLLHQRPRLRTTTLRLWGQCQPRGSRRSKIEFCEVHLGWGNVSHKKTNVVSIDRKQTI